MKNLLWWGIGALAILAAVWLMYAHRAVAPSVIPTVPITITDPSTLPGILTGQVPWPANAAQLAARMSVDNLAQVDTDASALHLHQHLDIFIDGQPIDVAENIGFPTTGIWNSPVHTEHEHNLIHVEAPFIATFTLGNFFDVWGVLFTSDCIGGYCADGTHALRVYVNGQLYQGDPRTLALAEHQEIVIIYGTADETPSSIPSSFTFEPGD